MELSEKELDVDILKLKKGALILRAINHKLRQEMLQLIHQNARMTVTDIYIKMRLDQPVASQHLAILRKAGYVLTERQGKRIFYSVNYQKVKQVHQIIGNLLG